MAPFVISSSEGDILILGSTGQPITDWIWCLTSRSKFWLLCTFWKYNNALTILLTSKWGFTYLYMVCESGSPYLGLEDSSEIVLAKILETKDCVSCYEAEEKSSAGQNLGLLENVISWRSLLRLGLLCPPLHQVCPPNHHCKRRWTS